MKKLITIFLATMAMSSPAAATDLADCIKDWRKFDFLEEKQPLYFFSGDKKYVMNSYEDIFRRIHLEYKTVLPIIYYESGGKSASSTVCDTGKCTIDDIAQGMFDCTEAYAFQVGSCTPIAASYNHQFYCLLYPKYEQIEGGPNPSDFPLPRVSEDKENE
ncbi:MAG: hypothetical protein CML23_00705 [Rhizobiaceae bacterium]|nr:hypothetical protein [Rhizobiaceae bacterium]